MYVVYNKFNEHVISRHRTIGAAMKAEKSFQRRFAKANPPPAYMPTLVMREVNGQQEPITDQEYESWYCTKEM